MLVHFTSFKGACLVNEYPASKWVATETPYSKSDRGRSFFSFDTSLPPYQGYTVELVVDGLSRASLFGICLRKHSAPKVVELFVIKMHGFLRSLVYDRDQYF